MERLTFYRMSGIKEGHWSPKKKQELVDRLADYEGTGLTPEQIMELKERDMEKAPTEVSEECSYFECPSCGELICAIDYLESHHFCLNCGQRIKWED